jgi:hypothetical protein
MGFVVYWLERKIQTGANLWPAETDKAMDNRLLYFQGKIA